MAAFPTTERLSPDGDTDLRVTLFTYYTNGQVHWRRTVHGMTVIDVLAWALANWHPARGPDGGLNEHLFVSVNDGEPEPVRMVLQREWGAVA